MARETYIELIIQFMTNNNHTGFDFQDPFVKPSLRYVYPLFMFLHASVGMVGIIGNTGMIIVIGKRRLYQDQTYFLMANLAFADLIKCMVVLPITLANLLIQNWLFGSFLCFFLPMMQCFPVHASMLTFLTIAVDRYRLIVYPFKSRLPAGLCIIAVWVGAVCVVLPYAIYIKYIDLGASLGDQFNGVGICYVYVERRIEEYIRAMFVTLYAMPLAIIALLYVRISVEIKTRENNSISVHYVQSATAAESEQDQSQRNSASISWSPSHQSQHRSSRQHSLSSTVTVSASGNAVATPRLDCPGRQQQQQQQPQHHRHSRSSHGDASSTESSHGHTGHQHQHHHNHQHHHHHHHQQQQQQHSHSKSYNERSTQDSDEELDIAKEKRTQNYLITMTTLFAMCWCPLHILILVNYFVHENDNNMGHYDITYILFAWFGFLSTCITPILFASWRMSDAAKDRLRGYFRFSNRRRTSAGSQRRRYQPRFCNGMQNSHFEEGMIMECRGLERYGCDSV